MEAEVGGSAVLNSVLIRLASRATGEPGHVPARWRHCGVIRPWDPRPTRLLFIINTTGEKLEIGAVLRWARFRQ